MRRMRKTTGGKVPPAPEDGEAWPRDLKLFFAARFLASVGIQMQSVAIGWQVFEITGRPLDLGLVGLAQFLPSFLFSLFTGDVADRFDRRRILLVCQLAYVCVAAALWWLSWTGAREVLPIYGILLVFGTARAFAAPASQALLPHLIAPSRFSRAVSLNGSIWQIALIAGPALGGIVYAAVRGGVYGVAGAVAVAAFGLLAAMRVETGRLETAVTSWGRLTAGIRYVWTRKIILGAISLDLFAVLLGGAVALLPVYAAEILHVGPTGLGLLRSAPPIGAAAMAALLAARPLRARVGPIMLGSVAVFGVATIVFGLSRNFGLSLVALSVLGAADMVSVVVRHTVVQLATPAAMRGRVSAVSGVFIHASNELGDFESGVVAQWLGTVAAVVVGGVGTLVVVGVWAWLFPSLRRVDRMEEVHAQPAAQDSGGG